MFGHGSIFVFVVLFQCLPVNAIWDRSIEAKCLSINAAGYAGAVMAVIEDIALIILPIPELLKLQVTGRKRVGLGIMFAIASL